MNLKRRRKARLATKEEEDIDVLRSWMEVGHLPACPEEEAKGLLTEVNLSPVFPMLPSSLYFLFVTNFFSQSQHWIVIGSFLLLSRGRRSAETGSRGIATGNRGVGKAQGGHSGV